MVRCALGGDPFIPSDIPMGSDAKIILLHHSSGPGVWGGGHNIREHATAKQQSAVSYITIDTGTQDLLTVPGSPDHGQQKDNSALTIQFSLHELN